MLLGENLSLSRQGRQLWQNLSFCVKPGQLMLITGPNGSGKSSLLKIIAHILSPTKGHIRRDAQSIAYLGHTNALYPAWSALTYLKKEIPEAAVYADCVTTWNLTHLLPLPLGQLSFGQCRRVALARITGRQKELWLLDEPTAGLDSRARDTLWECVLQHQQNGGAVVVTSHTPIPLPVHERIDLLSGSEGGA